MLLGEPRPTPYDLKFSVMGFDVRISPWFWLAAVLLGGRSGGPELLIWVVVVVVSILIHELGHALAFRYYGISSHIALYQFGGVAVPDGHGSSWGNQRSLSPQQQIVVSAAGPALQILAAVALILILRAGGFRIPFEIPEQMQGTKPLPSAALHMFARQFLFVSVYWALINLLPVYPLDGGQISRNVFQIFGSHQAVPYSLMLSVAVGGAAAFWGLTRGQEFLGIMFALLAYSSYQALSQYGGGFGKRW